MKFDFGLRVRKIGKDRYDFAVLASLGSMTSLWVVQGQFWDLYLGLGLRVRVKVKG